MTLASFSEEKQAIVERYAIAQAVEAMTTFEKWLESLENTDASRAELLEAAEKMAAEAAKS